ncbi:type V CRISPR-associated protein Cas4 [Sedimentisphaera cyanobacteriorum]|nr:type V CRISPR-associated protein Cas4 [Sedimentisphaera cyanobacteriorum]
MEDYIQISFLNDFIFCPRSIYFHQLFGRRDTRLYQDRPQVLGKASHKAIDSRKYTSRRNVLQGTEIFCRKYGLCGKIDIYYIDSHTLAERKRKIKNIYDGYCFQLYAQYFGLREMGYLVQKIQFYSMQDNKTYPIELPENNPEMLKKFENTIDKINSYDLSESFTPNPKKCKNCIYQPLCDLSLC